MIELKTEVVINANVNQVWQVLTNFAAYAQWNPFISAISGELVEGKKLVVTISPPGKKSVVFKPTVVHVKENQEVRWVGTLLVAALFRGEHYFRLLKLNDQQTMLIHGETFTGALVPLFASQLQSVTYQGFIQMNEALKNLFVKS